jgi:hypothetical protein
MCAQQCGRDRGVAEKLLDHVEINVVAAHLCREVMARLAEAQILASVRGAA